MGGGPPITTIRVAAKGHFGQTQTMKKFAPLFRLLAVLSGLALTPAHAYDAKEINALRDAQTLANQNDWAEATARAQGAGAVGADVIEWQRLRAGEGLLDDYEAFLSRRPDWPGLPYLKSAGEVALAPSTDPDRVLTYFAGAPPTKAAGLLALTAALDAKGRHADAVNAATLGWAKLKFTADEQTRLLAAYGPDLRVAHELRLDRILWDGNRKDEAARMLPLVSKDWAALGAARMALHEDKPGVAALVNAVPKALISLAS